MKTQSAATCRWKVLGNASVTEFEVTDRMTLLIPQILREFANLVLKAQVALIGMGSKFELWNLDNWEKKQSGLEVPGEDLIEDLPSSLEEIPF